MEASHSVPNVKRLIMVPALIALAITIVRLVGELDGGSSVLFNREAGGEEHWWALFGWCPSLESILPSSWCAKVSGRPAPAKSSDWRLGE